MFLICFQSVTGFTGFKTHAEKFCRFHSLLFPPQRAGRILKYSCLVFTDFAPSSTFRCRRGSEQSGPELGARGPLSGPASSSAMQQYTANALPRKHNFSEAENSNNLQQVSVAAHRPRLRSSSSAVLLSNYQQMAILH